MQSFLTFLTKFSFSFHIAPFSTRKHMCLEVAAPASADRTTISWNSYGTLSNKDVFAYVCFLHFEFKMTTLSLASVLLNSHGASERSVSYGLRFYCDVKWKH